MKSSTLLHLLFFVSFIMSPHISISQNFSQDSIQGYLFYKKADKSWKNVDTCYHYSKLALPLLKKTKQWDKYIYTLCGLSYCYNVRSEFDSMEINNTFAYQEAQRLLPRNHPNFIRAMNNLALLYSQVKDNELKALGIYKEAYEILLKLNFNDYPIQAPLEENIGEMYFRLGDFDTALKYYKQSISSWKSVRINNKSKIPFIRVARVYAKMANLFFITKNLTEAEYHIKECIQTLQLSEEYDPNFMLRSKYVLVDINSALGRYDNAFSQLNSLDTMNASFFDRARFHQLKGEILFKKNNIAEAISELNMGLQQPIHQNKIINKVKSYSTLSEIYFSKKQYVKSLENLQNAIRLIFPNASLDDNLLIPPTLPDYLKLQLFKILIKKGDALQHLHQHTNDPKYLEANLKNYLYLSQLTNDIRSFYQSDESELLLLEIAKNFYEDAIETAYLLFQEKKEKQYLEHAFFFTEKSKSELLLEELRKKEFSGRGIIADSLLTLQYELKTAILFNQKMIKKENAKTEIDASKIKSLEDAIFELENQLITLRDVIQKAYPNYTALTEQKPITINEFQKELHEEQVVLEYFVGEKNIYLFKITSSETDLLKIENNFGLDSSINALFEQLKMEGNNGVNQYASVAYDLYKKILRPAHLTENEKQLIIIPDGQLENLPFDILVTKNKKTDSPKKLPYLIKDFITSYAYSATIFSHQTKQQFQESASVIGVFPTFEQTEKELLFNNIIHKSLSRFSGDYFQDEEANIQNFLKHIEHHQVIHFSTHAKGNDSIYNEPSIDFEDGTLNLSDLQTYNLSATLAVLSACETNTGTYRKGEGIMSLSRGFTFAGVPSIITSTSNVFEESTSIIMQTLYKNLEEKMPKHEALRQAKIAYLTNTEIPISKSSPYYWGTFLAIGNTDSITFQYPQNKIIWIFLGIGFLSLIIFYWKKRTQ